MTPIFTIPASLKGPFTDDILAAEHEHAAQMAAIMREACDGISLSLAEKKDNLIREAITRRIGRSDWTIEEIIPRMRAFSYAPEISEATFYALDDVPLCAIWPIRSTVLDGKIQFSLPFQSFGP